MLQLPLPRPVGVAVAAVCSLSVVACSRTLYDATAKGERVVDWKSTSSGVASGTTTTKEVVSDSGIKYRVRLEAGTLGDRRLPMRVVVEVEDNPPGADVDVRCLAATHYDGDPPGLLSTVCEVHELTGHTTWFTKESRDDVSELKVRADGMVTLRHL